MPGFLSLRVPLLRAEVAEHDEVAPVVGHDLPVAAAQRPVGPPAVLDEPGLPGRPPPPARPSTARGLASRRGPRLFGAGAPPRTDPLTDPTGPACAVFRAPA